MKPAKLLLVAAAFLMSGAPDANAQERFDRDALIAYLKGVYLESENDFNNAYQYYLYAAAREPHNGSILLRLAKVASEIGELEDAKKYSQELIRADVHGAEARMILAEVEYRLGNTDGSLAVLRELLGMEDVPRYNILKFLAKIYREIKKPDEARRALEEASTLSEADPYVFYELGLIYAEEGTLDRAVETLEKAVAADRDFAPAHLALGKLFMHLKKREAGKRSFGEVLRIEPLNRSALKGLTDALYEDGEYAEGAAILEPLHRGGELDETAEIIFGRFLYKAGKSDEAIAVFNDLIAKTGAKPAFLRVVAEMEIERGHFKTAFAHMRKLVAVEPDRFENYIGILLVLYGVASGPPSPDEAIALTAPEKRAYLEEAARKVNFDSEENNYTMGSILRKAGESEEAERYLLRAEELNAKNQNTILELATLYGRTGKYDEALKRVVSLYAENPEDASLANFYGYLLAEKGVSLDLAETLLGKALTKEPDNGYFMDSLGWIRFKKGRFREALDILLKAAEKAGDDAVIWEHIGDAYAKLKESGKALEAYRKSLALDPKAGSVGEKVRRIETGENANE